MSFKRGDPGTLSIISEKRACLCDVPACFTNRRSGQDLHGADHDGEGCVRGGELLFQPRPLRLAEHVPAVRAREARRRGDPAAESGGHGCEPPEQRHATAPRADARDRVGVAKGPRVEEDHLHAPPRRPERRGTVKPAPTAPALPRARCAVHKVEEGLLARRHVGHLGAAVVDAQVVVIWRAERQRTAKPRHRVSGRGIR